MSNLWKALQCDPRWLLKSVFQMHHVSMTDGCQMAAWERAEKGTILACFCLTRPLDPQEKADTWCTRGGVPGEARLNREPQEKPYTIVVFSALSQIMVSCIPKSRKAGRRGKPGCSHPGRSCIFAQHKGQQNPLQESQWGSLLGQMHPSGSTSLLGGQAVFRWWDKGTASLWGSFHAWRARPSSVTIQAGLKGLSHCSSGFLIASLCL